MDIRHFFADKFELRKMDKQCNFNGCSKAPSKKVVIFEADMRNSDRRDLVDLFFCNDHYRSFLSESLDELKEFKAPWTTLGKKVSEIGYVTY